MASSHRAASWIEGQRSPTDVTWALFQHGRSVEPTRYCLAPVLEGLFRRVYPCLSCRRGIRAPSCTHGAITLAWHIPVIVVRFGRHGAFYLWQVWWSAQAGRKGRHELCSSQPYKPPTNHPARPLMQNFFRCAGQIATPCGARYPSWGEARRKSRQVRTKSTETRSSPRRFWNSRSRSSILNGAPVRQLAMLHWRLGSSGFCRRSTLQAGRGLSHAPGRRQI